MKESSVENKKNNKNFKDKKKRKEIVVAVSGGFDPLHIGHLQMIKEAKELGDKLVVILNNDNWLKKKKGYVFIPQEQRKAILEAIRWVDEVVLTSHPENTEDMSVSKELEKIKPDIFANGGDRTRKNIPEVEVCRKINCKMIFNIGKNGKIESSSWLLSRFLENFSNKK